MGVDLQQLLERLGDDIDIASQLVEGISRLNEGEGFTYESLTRFSSVPVSRRSSAWNAIDQLEITGILHKKNEEWYVNTSNEETNRINWMLKGAVQQAKVDLNTAYEMRTEIVLTRPRDPSRLDEAIRLDTALSVHIEDTEEAFLSMVAEASNRLVVMTPFLDEVGARWVLNLFKSVKSEIQKELILRFLDDPSNTSYPVGYPIVSKELSQLCVKVYDFALPRHGSKSLETFHAKAIGIDNNRIYIGSSNMNWASKENSMELGVVLRGKTAGRLFRVIDKILLISNMV